MQGFARELTRRVMVGDVPIGGVGLLFVYMLGSDVIRFF